MKYLALAASLAVGLALGWIVGRQSVPQAPAAPSDDSPWIARVGDSRITAEMFAQEMRRRGGERPGLFQDLQQKRALLDDMLFQQALVQAARREGIDQAPETRRSIEQLLVTQYLQRTLRADQQKVSVDDAELRRHYDANAGSYTIPARRRVAMLRIEVPKDADEDVWQTAEARAREAIEKTRAQTATVPHFGTVAREYSQDPASRYRGGVIGWLTEGRGEAYRYDKALLDAAYALQAPGDISGPVRGADGVYVARLVEAQPAQERDFEQLRAGIEQRLVQERYEAIEKQFRDEMLAAARVEVREDALAAIAPPGPPQRDQTPQPPAMPGQQEPTP